MPIKINNRKITSHNDDKTVRYDGIKSQLHALFGVCTGRMVENLYGPQCDIEEELKAWIAFLKQDFGKEVDGNNYDWWYVAYKAQLLIAVTNSSQVEASAALIAVGFVPSTPIYNKKYESYLFTWTYELNPTEDGEEYEEEE